MPSPLGHVCQNITTSESKAQFKRSLRLIEDHQQNVASDTQFEVKLQVKLRWLSATPKTFFTSKRIEKIIANV